MVIVFKLLLGGVVAAVVAAIIAGRISHRTKVSEFRQAWIDGLRNDIADYIGAAEQWFQKYSELNDIPDMHEKSSRVVSELYPIGNTALVILYRIKLRINPRNNLYKKDDDLFLSRLSDLQDPGKLDPNQLDYSWRCLADAAVEQGREILKREWQVTKAFFSNPWRRFCG